ncbi:MAG: 50S ribosomal protein L10, partial [bacterium]
MPKTRAQKKEELAKLTDRLSRMKSVVLSTTMGLKVSDVTKLRKLMRGNGAEYLVVKKTLLERAFAGKEIAYP